MLRSLRKAAQSLERNMETAFSTTPASRAAYVNKTLDINGHHIRLGQVFAEGGFSYLHAAAPTSSPSSIRYAVKRLACQDDESRAAAQREIEFLSTLPEHPNIVRFYGGIFYDGHAFLMFDLVDGGTLPQVLSRSKQQSPEKLLGILGDAAAAIAHLHSQDPPVSMRDVKLENLLYDRLAKCYKLCDFGSVSCFAGTHNSRKQILDAEDEIAGSCTMMYRAPELVDLYSKQFICERVDVWALGCVWHALLFDKLPFDGLSSLQILKGLVFVPNEPQYPEEYIRLLRRMLTNSPAERADSFEVLETVRKLQGTPLEDEVLHAASRLRARRKRDFGTAGTDWGGGNLLDTTTVPVEHSNNAPSEHTQSSSLIDFSAFDDRPAAMIPNSVSSRVETAAISQPAKDDEGWADFESAFGPSSSTAPKASSAAPSAEKRRVHAAQKPEVRTATASLIDFNDLSITRASAVTTQRPSVAPVVPQGRNSSRTAPDFSDLIDFSDGT